MLDEIRHAQLDLAFSHDLLKHDQRFDWCNKAFHTNEWGVIAVKNFFDDWMLNANCVEAAMATSLIVEHGFTNIQFVALAADAMEAGDIDFSNLLSTIQTDEARHAQQGFPTLEVLMKHDPERAQYIFDVAFWRSFRLFQTLTGTSMDYYTPLAKRKLSFKEFMLEWVVHHHERTMKDYGLDKPWYWDTFMQCLDHGHHAMHIGTWFWRPTLFWKPNAGVSKAERAMAQRASTRPGKTAGACCGTRSSPTSIAATWRRPIPRRCRRCATSPSCRSARPGTAIT